MAVNGIGLQTRAETQNYEKDMARVRECPEREKRKDLCPENLMNRRRMLAAFVLQVSLFAFWRVANNVDGLILSTYVQDHLILLTAHILHTHHCGISLPVAIHTLTSSVVPTCDRHLPASSKVKSKAHIISSQSITDTPIHARMPDSPKRINVKISTNISSCMRVSMSR